MHAECVNSNSRSPLLDSPPKENNMENIFNLNETMNRFWSHRPAGADFDKALVPGVFGFEILAGLGTVLALFILKRFSITQCISCKISADLLLFMITTWADNACIPDVMVHICKSNTPVTPLTLRIEFFISS